MATPTVFAPTYDYIDGRLDLFLGSRLSSIMLQVEPPLRLSLLLYVTLYGVAILRGSIREPFVDFALRGVKLGLLFSVATTAAYSSWVTQPLFHVLPNTIAKAISGSDVTNVGSSFDKFLDYGGALADKISSQGGIQNISAYVTAGVVFIVTVVAAALGFGVVMIAKVALALLVALGPIFIGCALFEATRRFFFGWLAQAVNYLTLFALIITVFELVLALVQQQWPSIDSQPNAEVAGMLFSALCVLGAIFFLQTPAIAAGIAGGASTGLADFGAVGAAMLRPKPPVVPLAPPSGSGRGGGAIRDRSSAR